jgi:hypothetical protein
MQRFRLNIVRDDGIIPDIEDQEFASLQDAYLAAEASLCEIAADRLRAQLPILLEAIQIVSVNGEVLATASTHEAISRYLPPPRPSLLSS